VQQMVEIQAPKAFKKIAQSVDDLVSVDICDELSKGLGFQSIESLNKYTKDVEESSKLMLAHYYVYMSGFYLYKIFP
jgi:hypothetical protein